MESHGGGDALSCCICSNSSTASGIDIAMEKWKTLLILASFTVLTLLLNVNYLRFHSREEGQPSLKWYSSSTDVYASHPAPDSRIGEDFSNESSRYLGENEVNSSTEALINPISIKPEKVYYPSEKGLGDHGTFNTSAVKILTNKLRVLSLQSSQPTPHSTLPTPVQGSAVRGYILAEDYWEQQTAASRSLQDLQCWAAKLGLSVVEPFIHKSQLKSSIFGPHPKKGEQVIKFGDLFSLEVWNRYSVEQKHAVLVPWEDFIQVAPKNVIVANFLYKDKNNQQLPKQDPSSSERYKTGCPTAWPNAGMYSQLKTNHFTVIRKVCFNFLYRDRLTAVKFINHLYGDYSPDNVTVIFHQWRGTERARIKDSGCHSTPIQEHAEPSPRVVRDAGSYTQKYLKGGKYIAIMARLEKTKITIPKKGIIPFCFQQIIKYWNNTRTESGIETTFLSIDIGKYGSNSFYNTGDGSNLHEEFGKFTRQLYGESFSITKWENTFEDASHTTNAGYIALLQKAVVTGASCVIFVGGGSFQKHALHLYRMLHENEEPCIKIITECTTRSSLSL